MEQEGNSFEFPSCFCVLRPVSKIFTKQKTLIISA
jgi:hypothetical protein